MKQNWIESNDLDISKLFSIINQSFAEINKNSQNESIIRFFYFLFFFKLFNENIKESD